MKRQVSKGKPWKRGTKNIVVDAVQFFYHLQLFFFNQGSNPKQGQNSFEPLVAWVKDLTHIFFWSTYLIYQHGIVYHQKRHVPSGNSTELLNMAIEIVDLASYKMVMFHSYANVYQRRLPPSFLSCKLCHFPYPRWGHHLRPWMRSGVLGFTQKYTN